LELVEDILLIGERHKSGQYKNPDDTKIRITQNPVDKNLDDYNLDKQKSG